MIDGWVDDGSRGMIPMHKIAHGVMVSHLPSATSNVVLFGKTQYEGYCKPGKEIKGRRLCFSGLGKKLVLVGRFYHLGSLGKSDFATMGQGKVAIVSHSSGSLRFPVFYDEVRTLVNMGYSIFTADNTEAYLKAKKAVLLVRSSQASTGLDYTDYGSLVLICEAYTGYTKQLQQAVGRVVRPTNKRKKVVVTFLLTQENQEPEWVTKLGERLFAVNFHCLRSFQDAIGKSDTTLKKLAREAFRNDAEEDSAPLVSKCGEETKKEILELEDKDFLYIMASYAKTDKGDAWACEGREITIKETKARRLRMLKKLRPGKT